jgi:hypothetical protein
MSLSSSIFIASIILSTIHTSFNADLMAQVNPLQVVSVSSNKLSVPYSIFVTQVGITQNCFQYWASLAKSTQGARSLFDQQPSMLTENTKTKIISRSPFLAFYAQPEYS